MSGAALARRRAPARALGAERLVAAAGLGVAAVVTAAGLWLEADGRELGTALPPYVMGWGPKAHPAAVVALAVAAACVAGLPHVLNVRRPALVLTAAALALGLAINAARHGPWAWSAVLDPGPGGAPEARNEYLAGLGALSYGPRFFLDRFAELVPALPVHVAGHPPGFLITLDVLGLATPGRAAALCIAATALLAPLTLALGRAVLYDEHRARLAGVLAAASPCALLFGITSADAAYAALGTGAAAALAARRPAVRAGGAAVLAGASLFSWTLLAAGAWATVLASRRAGLRNALALAATCALAVVLVQGALAAATGYDPLGTLRATEAVYRHSLASVRPYAFWVLGSPVAWGVTLGLPIAALALVAAGRRTPAGVALAVVVAVSAAGGFSKAETERIWLPFVPLACVAAAEVLPAGRLRLVVGALLAQAIATQLLFATVW